jgi:NhaP-type Na+/H+ or K+/H+ antiporter
LLGGWSDHSHAWLPRARRGARTTGAAAPPGRHAELVLFVVLPGLVFDAAYRLHWEDLRRSSWSIAFLAAPGVLISATLSASTDRALARAWGPLAAALNALIFIAVGIAVVRTDMLAGAAAIAWGVLAVLVARALIVYLLIGGAGAAFDRRLPAGWLHPLFWAGLRGGVATAAALSLPLDFPERDLLQRITFGIVLVTLLVQGSSAGWLVRRIVPKDQPASTLRTTYAMKTT